MANRMNFSSDYSGFLVSTLPAYVQTNEDILIQDIVLPQGGTIERMSKQLGIKKDAYLNYLDVEPDFQDGSDCGFTAQGEITLSQREIETALIKVNMDICPKTLIGKYAEYLVRIHATEESLPFEQYILDETVKRIKEKMDYAVWQWDATEDDEFFDGLLAIAADEVSAGTATGVSISSGSSAYEGILAVYMALPEEVLERGAEIYVSPAIYRKFIQEMVALDLFHFSAPEAAYPGEVYLPGSDAKVVKTTGLKNSLKIVGTYAKNMVYGADLEGASEEIDLWWSKDDRVFKLAVEWNAGVQFYFPAWVVLGTFAAAPVSPTTSTVTLGDIKAQLTALAASMEAVQDVLEDVHNEAKKSLNTTATA